MTKTPLLLASLLGAVLLTSCASPLKSVKEFGAATGAVGTSATDAYKSFDENFITAKSRTKWLTTRKSLPLRETVGPFAEGGNLLARQKLLDALVAYSTSLEALAGKTDSADVAAATEAIERNLTSVSVHASALSRKSYAIPPAAAGVLSETIRLGANAYNEWQREKAIREIVPAVNPLIQDASKLLADEMRSMGPTLYVTMADSYDAWKDALDTSDAKNSALAGLDDQARLISYSKEINKIKPYYSTLRQAALKVGETHAALAVAVKNRKFDSAEFSRQLTELNTYVDQLRKYFSGPSDKP